MWHDGCRGVAQRLADEYGLTAPWGVDTAADLLSTVMFPETLERLTVDRQIRRSPGAPDVNLVGTRAASRIVPFLRALPAWRDVLRRIADRMSAPLHPSERPTCAREPNPIWEGPLPTSRSDGSATPRS